MQSQWYLCQFEEALAEDKERLRKENNLAVHYPDTFVDGIEDKLLGVDAIDRNREGDGGWYVWLPIIPRVGDTLQFPGKQVQVSRVIVKTDWKSETGVKEGLFLSAQIVIRDDVVPMLLNSRSSVDASKKRGFHQWERFARRGNDLQYFAWELRHQSFQNPQSGENSDPEFLHWHSRIRPIAGDVILVENKHWRVVSVELASANEPVDGWLVLEAMP